MENSPLSHSMSRLSFELNGSGSSGSIVPESRSAKLERNIHHLAFILRNRFI